MTGYSRQELIGTPFAQYGLDKIIYIPITPVAPRNFASYTSEILTKIPTPNRIGCSPTTLYNRLAGQPE
jgi:hypothetical protein